MSKKKRQTASMAELAKELVSSPQFGEAMKEFGADAGIGSAVAGKKVGAELMESKFYVRNLGKETREIFNDYSDLFLSEDWATGTKAEIFERLHKLEVKTASHIHSFSACLFLMGYVTGFYAAILMEKDKKRDLYT